MRSSTSGSHRKIPSPRPLLLLLLSPRLSQDPSQIRRYHPYLVTLLFLNVWTFELELVYILFVYMYCTLVGDSFLPELFQVDASGVTVLFLLSCIMSLRLRSTWSLRVLSWTHPSRYWTRRCRDPFRTNPESVTRTHTSTVPVTHLSTTSNLNIFAKFALMKLKICRQTTSRYYYRLLPFFWWKVMNKKKLKNSLCQCWAPSHCWLTQFCRVEFEYLNSSHFGLWQGVTGRKVGRGRLCGSGPG
jgi:hypothetical protein